MSPIIHIVFYIFLVSCFYCFSLGQESSFKSSNTSFWKKALIPIILFILIEGVRANRGHDWPAYRYRFEHLYDEDQIGFYYYVLFLKNIGFNYVGYFMCNAAVFIIGMFYFIRSSFDKQIAAWMFLFLFMGLTFKAESQIRQYIAMPLIFVSISSLINKKKIIASIFLIIALSIHTGTIVCFIAFVYSFFFLKKKIPIACVLIALFCAYYIIPGGVLTDLFSPLLSKFQMDNSLSGEHFVHYIEDQERWFGRDSYLKETEQTIVTKSLQFLFEVSILFLSSKLLDFLQNRSEESKVCPEVRCKRINYQFLLASYNLICLGFVLERLFYGFEIFQRITNQLYIYWFIPAGYALYFYRHSFIRGGLCKVAIHVAILYQILYWGRFIFLCPDAEFVWDL